MRRFTWNLCLASLFVAFCAPAMSQENFWRHYNPPGCVDGQGILQEVLSRCDAQGRQNAYEPDLVTYCHEATHQLNGRIRNTLPGNWNALYVGGDRGLCVIFPEPRVTLQQAAQFVSPQMRTSTFQLYFVDMAQYWNQQPLYILDEWVAYTNGSQAAKELRVDPHGTYERAMWFCHYTDAVIAAVEAYDPSYSHMPQLQEFVRWHKGRVEGVLGTQVAGYRPRGDATPAAQVCINGKCQNPVVTWIPRNQNPPQPTQPKPQPGTVTTSEKLKQDWLAYIKIEVANQVKAQGESCQCGENDYATNADLQALTVQVNSLSENVSTFTDKLTAINETNIEINQKLADLPAPYQPPTDEKLAEQIGPHLKHSATIMLLDGSKKVQTKPLNVPLDFTQRSVAIKQ